MPVPEFMHKNVLQKVYCVTREKKDTLAVYNTCTFILRCTKGIKAGLFYNDNIFGVFDLNSPFEAKLNINQFLIRQNPL